MRLLSGVLLLLVVPQDKVRLELKAKKGERYTLTLKETTDGKVQVGDQTFPFKESELLKYEDEVLDVEGAAPSRVRRTVVEWAKAKQEDPEAAPEKRPRHLQGKAIVLKRNGEKTEYEGAEGVPAAELKEHQLRVDTYLTHLPKEAVGLGHEWKLDEKRLLEDFNEGADEGPVEFKAAKGVAKLEKVEDQGGVRCAVLGIDVTGEGQIKEQMDVKIAFKMKVQIVLALDAGRVLGMKGTGTGDMKGEVDAGGEKAKMTGSFAFTLDSETRYRE